jgi:hypothetical protein
MSTLPPGQGPPVGVGTGALCAPGLVAVSVTVTDCATGANLGTVVPFTVSTSDGQFTTSVNGVVVIQCAAAGFRFHVGCDNYNGKDVTLTADHIRAQHVAVCLDKKPPPPARPPHCVVHSLTRTDDDDPSDAALAPYYRVRDAVAGTPTGARLVELYYDPETKKRMFTAIQKSPELRIEGLALIIELGPVLRAVGALEGGLRGLRGACEPAPARWDEPLLPREAVRRASRFLDRLEEASGAEELVALTRELLKAGDGGLHGVARWLSGDVRT